MQIMPPVFLRTEKCGSCNSIDYKISNIIITTYPEPDPDQYYFIELGIKFPKVIRLVCSPERAGVILAPSPAQPIPWRFSKSCQSAGTSQEPDKDAFGELFKIFSRYKRFREG